MPANVVGFGPSMVDICAPLNAAQYDASHELLGVEPGGWRLVEEPWDVDRLLQIVGVECPDFQSVDAATGPTMAAGSSTLGMLGAMPPHIRNESTLVTTLATRGEQLDPWSEYFSTSVGRTGITHEAAALVEGRNPLGFVLYRYGQGGSDEKTLAMHPGVAQSMAEYSRLEDTKPDLVLIDSYELKQGELSGVLDRIITSGEHRIALSLGNHMLLEGGLHARVRKYIEGGSIFAVCGNEQEYRSLYPELDEAQTTRPEFGDHPVGGRVPYVLMTRGGEGMDGFWKGKYIKAKAYPTAAKDIVNTSGAGDTAMGVFCGGLLDGEHPNDTLAKAAYFAAKVLSIPSSMILAKY